MDGKNEGIIPVGSLLGLAPGRIYEQNSGHDESNHANRIENLFPEEKVSAIIEKNYKEYEKVYEGLGPFESSLMDIFAGGRYEEFPVSRKNNLKKNICRDVLFQESLKNAEPEKKTHKKRNPAYDILAEMFVSLFNNKKLVTNLCKCESLNDLKLVLYADMKLSDYKGPKERVLEKLPTSSVLEFARYTDNI